MVEEERLKEDGRGVIEECCGVWCKNGGGMVGGRNGR